MNKSIYFVLLYFFLTFSISSVKADQCAQLQNEILKQDFEYPGEIRNDVGIFYDYEWNEKEKLILIKRDINEYPLIRYSLFNKSILIGDAVKFFNNIDLSKQNDNEILNLVNNSKKAEIELTKSQNIFTVNQSKYIFKNFILFNFEIKSINEIDTKKGIFNISYDTIFTLKRHEFNEISKKINLTETCNLYELQKIKLYEPLKQLRFNTYKDDVDIKTEEPSYITYDAGMTKTVLRTYGVGEFRNEFNFRKFPFDEQNLVIKININHKTSIGPEGLSNPGIPQINLISPASGPFVNLKKYKEKVSKKYLKEWSVVSSNIQSKVEKVELFDVYSNQSLNFEEDAIYINIKLKRNSEYFLYKIIIPIFLILSIAWAVLFIPTPQIESRLTTSIVSLLALIAYNFVFHDDIPKLEYLTNLDLYILLSYFFCAIPTFMSIILSRNVAFKPKLSTLINKRVRFWGALVYFAQVFLIFST